MQTDLFAPPLASAPPRVCGSCVVRNAINEAQLEGACSRTGQLQHRDAPACAQWFGLAQLRAPLYGKAA